VSEEEEELTRCCVCHQRFPEVRWLGGRAFCEGHYHRALEASEASWSRAGIVEAALIAAFVASVAFVFGPEAQLPTSFGLGLMLALVPAAIWLTFVYRQDRVEPEPLGVVLFVFLLGGLLGYGLALPIEERLLGLHVWEHGSSMHAWVNAVAVTATLQTLCAYLAVRYSVYFTDEFDEPVDGIIYTVAAGLGVATVVNVDFLLTHDHVLPLAGATAIANNALIGVASSVVLGYGMGRARFEPEHAQRWMSGCFLGGVLMHGVFHELVAIAGTDQATYRPWLAFAVALGLGLAVVASGHFVMARFSRQSLEEGAR